MSSVLGSNLWIKTQENLCYVSMLSKNLNILLSSLRYNLFGIVNTQSVWEKACASFWCRLVGNVIKSSHSVGAG